MEELIYKSPEGVLGAVPTDMQQEAINQRYTKATPEEEAEFKRQDNLLKKSKKVSPVPSATEEQIDASEFETALAETVGNVITPSKEERERLYGSIGPDPRFAEAQGVIGTTMTALEQFIGGASGDIIPNLVGLISPEYQERKEIREAANPTTAKVSDVLGLVVPTGASILKAVGYAGKGAGAVQKAAKLDVFNRALESMPAQKLYERYMSKIVGEEAFGKALDEAVIKGEDAVREAKLLAQSNPDFMTRTIGRILQKDATDIAIEAGEKAAEKARLGFELTEIEKLYVSKLEQFGAESGIISSMIKAYRRGDPVVKAAVEGGKNTAELAKAVAGKAAPAAISAGVFGGISQGLEAAANAQLSGEDIASEFWSGLGEGAKTGAVVGGTIAAAVPSIAYLGGDIIDGVNAARQAFSTAVIPKLGSIFTKVDPKDLQALLKASPGDAATFDIAAEKVARDLTKEYDRAKKYFPLIMDRLKQTNIVDDASYRSMKQVFDSYTRAFEKDFMKESRGGKLVIDRDKFIEWTKDSNNWNAKTNELIFPDDLEMLFSLLKKQEDYLTLEATLPSKPSIKGLQLVTDEYETLLDTSKENAKFLEGMRQGLARNYPDATGGLEAAREAAKGISLQKLLQERMGTVEKAGLINPFEKFGLPYVGAAGAIGADPSLDGALRAAGILTAGGVGKIVTDVFVNPAETVKLMYEVNRIAERSSEASKRAAASLFTKGGRKATGALATGTVEFLKPVKLGDKEEREIYLTERDKLNSLSDINALTDALNKTYGQLEKVSPERARIAKDTAAKGVEFLRSKLPPTRQNGMQPTTNEVRRFNKFYRYVKNPDSVMAEMEQKGFVVDDGLEVLKALYPSKLQDLRQKAIGMLVDKTEAGETIDQMTRYNIDKLIGQSTSGFSPTQVKSLQQSMQPKGGNASGGSGKVPQLEREGLPK